MSTDKTAETAAKEPDALVVESRDDMLIRSMERLDFDVFSFLVRGNPPYQVWVIAKSEHKARQALAEHMIQDHRKVSKTELSKMYRDALAERMEKDGEIKA